MKVQTYGEKHDHGKPRYDLEQTLAIEEYIKVLTFGAEKYSPDNWRKVPDLHRRYYAAARRHMASWKKGEAHDGESGLHHLAHAMCCIAFLLELELEGITDEI